MIDAIRKLDADVTSIEAARSRMEVVDDLSTSGFDHGIGPGVYDIHSPRVPSVAEVQALLERAVAEIPASRLWVNPDCGLKTRGYDETVASLEHIIEATRAVRAELGARAAARSNAERPDVARVAASGRSVPGPGCRGGPSGTADAHAAWGECTGASVPSTHASRGSRIRKRLEDRHPHPRHHVGFAGWHRVPGRAPPSTTSVLAVDLRPRPSPRCSHVLAVGLGGRRGRRPSNRLSTARPTW